MDDVKKSSKKEDDKRQKEIEKQWSKAGFNFGLYAVFACLLLILAFYAYKEINKNFLQQKEGELTVTAESALEKIKERTDLSTAMYTYNSVVTVYEDEKIKYHAAYKGKITAGVDLSKFTLSKVTSQNKPGKLIITIPKAEIQDTNIDQNSIDCIFTNNKYNTETVQAEAINKCSDDLKRAAAEDERIKEAAQNNAINSVKALIEPLVKDSGYTVEVKVGESE